jgi:LuxR family transcriptional regulator, maltose regulon positive regulatory protein
MLGGLDWRLQPRDGARGGGGGLDRAVGALMNSHDENTDAVEPVSGNASPAPLTALSKITAPRLSGAHLNERLFDLLDEARARPAVWVHGPPGAGKTTLVASYLKARGLRPLWYRLDEGDADLATFFYYLGLAAREAAPKKKAAYSLLRPEYSRGIPAFTRRFFENLFKHLPPRCVLVFDDYHEVPPDALLQECLPLALSEIPPARNVILISRSEPPPQLARLRVNGAVHILPPDALRLTEIEAEGLIQRRGGAGRRDVAALVERTQGWVAGLVLLLEAGTSETAAPAGSFVPDVMFDYFAGEIFREMDTDAQNDLLQLAFLPSASARMAESLTGRREAGAMLEALSRRNYFTSKDIEAEPHYRLHPLFREFLLSTARARLSSEELASIRRRAAEALEAAGQPNEAIELLSADEAWTEIAAIIRRWAKGLFEQGRGQTLAAWLDRLPATLLNDSAWLCYWRGAALLWTDPGRNQSFLERAYELFKSDREPTGVFLAWATICDAIRFNPSADQRQLDRMDQQLDALTAEYPAFPSPEVALSVALGAYTALERRAPNSAKAEIWRKRALALAQSDTTIGRREYVGFMIAIYDLQSGRIDQARALLDNLPAPAAMDRAPLAQHLGFLVNAYFQQVTSHMQACLATVSESVETSDRTGIHIWDAITIGQAVMVCDAFGQFSEAENWLRLMAKRSATTTSFYDTATAMHLSMKGDHQSARRHAEMATELASAVGWRFFEMMAEVTLAQVLFAAGERAGAEASLSRGQQMSDQFGVDGWQADCLVLQSDLGFASDPVRSDEALRRGIGLAREAGGLVFQFLPAVLGRTCARALALGIEPAYVRSVISKRGLMPPDDDSENWPWPFEISTLGPFVLRKDSEPVAFARKAPKKLVSLLKAIVAFGGADVPENKLVDALWSDQDGDAGHRAFSIALYRLRKLLDDPKAIVLANGCVALDPARCWIDTATFERLFRQAESALREGSAQRHAELCEKALALYRGDFLVADDEPWAAPTRERLRGKYIRAAFALTKHLIEAGDLEKAIECCKRGLEVAPLAEALCQDLIKCCERLGRGAEARVAYDRLRAALAADRGAAPSSRTEMLLRSLPAD